MTWKAFARLACLVLPFAAEAMAEIQCNSDVGSQVAITRGGYRLFRRGNVFVQEVTVRNNTGSPIQGPVGLILQGLSSNATLVNGSATNPCSVSGPSTEIPPGQDNVFSPGETITVVFQFQNPSNAAIQYTLRVFAGQSALAPVSGIEIAPDGVIVGSPTVVTIKALAPYSGAIPTVTVEKVTPGGQVLGTLAALVDNGNLSQGDEIAGDGLFTGKVTFNESTPGIIKLRARRLDGSTASLSGLFQVIAFNNVTPSQMQGLITAQNNYRTQYENLLAQNGGNVTAAVQALLALILADPLVENAGTSGGAGIWIAFKNGILGGLMLNPPGTKGGALAADEDDLAARLSAFGARPAAAAGGKGVAQVQPGNVDVKSKKVAILSPYLHDFQGGDDGPGLNALYTAQGCPKYEVLYKTNADVTLSLMRSLKGYGVVHISSHGDTFYKGNYSAFTQQNYPDGVVVFLTYEDVTTVGYISNLIDLLMQRVSIISIGANKNVYTVLPAFVTAHMSLNDGLVFASSCRSTYNSTMADAFLGKGAKTYLGFTEYVSVPFAKARVASFHNDWITDPTSLLTTGEVYGANGGYVDPVCCTAPQTLPAQWTMAGSTKLEATDPGELQNGDFETGTLGGWTASGDGRVIPQLGPFAPTQGNYMGIISTGLGFTTTSGQISQNACISPVAKTLSFDWNFSSAEFIEYCGSAFQDYFRVELVSDTGAVTTLFNKKVDDLCPTVSPTNLVFDRADVWSTGWRTETINIQSFAAANQGKPVTLRLSAGDVGDSIYDTAILIDKVQVNK